MQALTTTIQTLGRQLSGFSNTARLLIAALMVILVMGLLLVAQFAGRSNMVPLGLGASLSEDSRARAVTYLNSRSIRWEESGGDLLVPVDQKYAVYAQLTEQNLISTDQIDFNKVLQSNDPFGDRKTKSRQYLVAKMNEVARMISEIGSVQRAGVMIDQPERGGGLGASHIPPSASVSVLTESEPLTQRLADSIARMVAGAHAPLKVENITVVDARTGRAMKVRSEDDMAPTVYLDIKQAAEKLHRQKIRDLLSVIPGVVVEVNAQVDVVETVTRRSEVKEPVQGILEESTRSMNSSNQSGGAPPGVGANVGAQLPGGGSGRTSTMADTATSTKMVPYPGSVASEEHDPKGYAVQINATVLVPKSYFLRLYRDRRGDETADPDQAALDTLVQMETQRIKSLVEPLVDTGPISGAVAGTVVVSMFADFAVAGVGALEAGGSGFASGSGGGVGGSFVSENIIKTVGLGALALVSLLLMFMMVRRAGREEEMPTAEELVGIPPALAQAESDIVGEASESAPAMEGLEIDEGDLRRQQMLDQVNALAKNDPDEAAILIRKWIGTHD